MNSWEDLENEALLATKRLGGKLCMFGRFVAELDDKAQGFVDLALNNEKIGHSPLHKALVARGFPGSREVVSRHRKKECSCYKGTI